MDDSRKLGDSSPTTDPCQNGERSGENPGATAVFGTMPDPNTDSDPRLVAKVAQEGAAGEFGELREGAPQAPTHAGREGLQEPIVYKVVLGGGAAIPPVDLLQMLRTNSPATQHTVAPTLAEPQSRPRTAAFQATPAPAAGYARGQSSEGFTQLLRALSGDSLLPAGPPEAVERTAERPDSGLALGFTELLGRPTTSSVHEMPEAREEPKATLLGASPSDGTGGFTALLQGLPGTTPSSGLPGPGPGPLNAGPEGVGPFTQLFESLTPEAAEGNLQAANTQVTYPERKPVDRPSGGDGPFTQLMSILDEEPGKPATYGDNRSSIAEDYSQRQSLLREAPPGSSQLPTGTTDWPRDAAPRGEFSLRGVGLGQILETLEEPGKGPEFRLVNSPEEARLPAPGAGFFTGPSEYTRAIDASKMREMLRGGLPNSAPVSQVAPVQPLTAPSPPAVTPPAPNVPWPMPAPWQSRLPPAQMPAAALPPAPAVAPAMGKMQQYLPLLLIIIIFLLVVILVTVVFLLKH